MRYLTPSREAAEGVAMESNILGQAFIFIFGAIVCIIVGFFLNRILGRQRADQANKDAGGIRELAQREAETIRKEAELQAKDLLLKMRQDFEKETKERRDELSQHGKARFTARRKSG